MDYHDNDELYAKKVERKQVRLSRQQQQSEDTKNIIATGIALAVTFCMIVVMISQLASCSTPPPPPTLEERWNEATYKTASSLGLIATKEKGSKIIFVKKETTEDK